MNYEEWEKNVPQVMKGDSLWKMAAYRWATLLGDLSWHDVTNLLQDRRTLSLSDQLYRAVGSIGANLAEGYSRGTGKDRARFYEYSLGSARESRDWYFKARHILGGTISEHRMNLLTEIIRLLLTMVPQQRDRVLREDGVEYEMKLEDCNSEIQPIDMEPLLQNIPLPQ